MNHILSKHKKQVTHMITSPLKCEICGMSFKKKLYLCKHLVKHYSGLNRWDSIVSQKILKLVTVKNYCWICKCTFRWQMHGNFDHGIMRDLDIDETLTQECVTEELVEPLKCEKCNEICSTQKQFWVHVKKHTMSLPIENSIDKNFRVNSRILECNECQYKCKKIIELNKHLTSNFLCEIRPKLVKRQRSTVVLSKSVKILTDKEGWVRGVLNSEIKKLANGLL